MPNTSEDSISIGSAWTDLVAENAALGGADVDLQFNGSAGGASCVMRLGGTEPASGATGRIIPSGDSVTVNATAIWVRSERGGSIEPVLVA